MALLWDASLTDAGVSMISQWAQGTGNKLTITGGVIGEGVVSASQLHALTQLTDEKSTISIQGFESVANGVKLKLRKTSQGITTSFILNQIGIYAKLDTSGGTPIIADSLIAVYQQDTGILVPTEADSPDFVFTFYGTIQTNYSGDLTINVDTSALASQDDLDALTLAGLADTDANTPSENNLLFFKGSTDKWTAQANPFSNENILTNWDFTHPINETGATSGTFAPVREILGKWETDYNGDGSRTYAITSQGLQINNDQAAVGFVKQTFETALDASKTYTLTIEFSDDHKETATGDLTSLLYTAYYSGISLQCTDTYVQLRIQASAGGTVARVKVETGNISTLANDVAPNQTLELLKCQNANVSGLSNENFVDNPWFTVNQRGFSSAIFQTGNVYTVDRWFIIGETIGGSVSLSSSGMKLSRTGESSPGYLTQFLEGLTLGKPYTLSVLFSDGTIESKAGIINSTADSISFSFANGLGSTRIYYFSGGSKWTVDVIVFAGSEFTIRAVKLELGSVSTLANDVAPNYTTELLKCQRYFERIKLLGSANSYALFGIGYADSTAVARVIIWCQPKRTLPTLSFTGSFYLGTNAVTGMAAQQMTNAGIAANVASSGLVQDNLYVLVAGNTGYYIDLSADL